MMLNKEKNFVSAVIYVHNAENRIETFVKEIIKVMETNFEQSEIICVNDSSDDNSLEIIKKTSELASTTSISVINMSYFHGVELSMNAGVDMAIGDFVFEFDNTILDFETPTIMDVYRHALNGYDIVSASPQRKEKFTSKLFYSIFNKYTQLSYRMVTESFRILSRRVINRIKSMNKTIPYRKAIYANCGLDTDNISYKAIYNEDVYKDKKERKFRTELATDTLILFTNVGYSFAKIMTFIMMIVSIFMSIYSITIFVTSNPVAGWTTTILFLSVAFFGLFGILTIIIKYLQLLIDLVFKRKHYTYKNIEKLTK